MAWETEYDVGPLEVEEKWLVQWLTIQDRLGLGPDNGDVYMKEVAEGGCEMIPEVEEGMGMVKSTAPTWSGWSLNLKRWTWTSTPSTW